jgi:hypothetical protein
MCNRFAKRSFDHGLVIAARGNARATADVSFGAGPQGFAERRGIDRAQTQA